MARRERWSEPLVALFLGMAAESREVEQPGIEQMRGNGEGRIHATSGILLKIYLVDEKGHSRRLDVAARRSVDRM